MHHTHVTEAEVMSWHDTMDTSSFEIYTLPIFDQCMHYIDHDCILAMNASTILLVLARQLCANTLGIPCSFRDMCYIAIFVLIIFSTH